MNIQPAFASVIISLSLISCHQEYNRMEKIENPLDTIPLRSEVLVGGESGYYKKMYADGSLQWLEFMCNGQHNGMGLIFQENGLFSTYTEHDKGVMTLKITYKLNGVPQDCWHMGKVFWFNGKDTIPENIQERVDFINRNCSTTSDINWDAVLVNSCE